MGHYRIKTEPFNDDPIVPDATYQPQKNKITIMKPKKTPEDIKTLNYTMDQK